MPPSAHGQQAQAQATEGEQSCGDKADGHQSGSHIAHGDNASCPVQSEPAHVDVDQRQAEQGGAAFVLIVGAVRCVDNLRCILKRYV